MRTQILWYGQFQFFTFFFFFLIYYVHFLNNHGSLFFSVYSSEVRLGPALQHFSILSRLWLLGFFPVQKFYGYVEQIESWLSSKEAFLANEDLGVRALRSYNFLCNLSGGEGTVQWCALNLPVLFLLLKLLLCPVGGLGSDFFPWYFAQDGNLIPKSNETIQELWLQ